MGKSLKSLASSMRRKAERVPEIGNMLKVAGSRATLKELVEITPVDTSEAISNWQIGVGSRPPISLQPHFLGRRGSTRASSAGKSIDEGNIELKLARPGVPVFISNTAPYIGDLDRGTSMQFAGGFVPRALIIFRLALQTAKKNIWK